MKEFAYDALVLVHPDFGRKTKNPNYKESLASVVEFLEQRGIPIFHLDGCASRVDGIRELLVRAVRIPVIDHHYETEHSNQERRDLQTEVNFIAKILGKKPRDISLGFGGTYTTGCVYYYAFGWCNKVETVYLPEDKKSFVRCQNPCKSGLVLDELV